VLWRDLKEDKYFVWSVAGQAFAVDPLAPNALELYASLEKMLLMYKNQGKMKKWQGIYTTRNNLSETN